jgi:hypothetical protein
LLEFGEAGVLVSPESPKEIAAALGKLMSDPIALQAFRAKSTVMRSINGWIGLLRQSVCIVAAPREFSMIRF